MQILSLMRDGEVSLCKPWSMCGKKMQHPRCYSEWPSNAVSIQGPLSRRESIDEEVEEQDEEAAILSPEDSAAEQEMILESRNARFY